MLAHSFAANSHPPWKSVCEVPLPYIPVAACLLDLQEEALRMQTAAADRKEAELAAEASRLDATAPATCRCDMPAPCAPHQLMSSCQQCSACCPLTCPSFSIPCRSVSSELAALQTRLAQAERLARLEVELAAREAEARLKVRTAEQAATPTCQHIALS